MHRNSMRCIWVGVALACTGGAWMPIQGWRRRELPLPMGTGNSGDLSYNSSDRSSCGGTAP